jgi:hypothetical protein
LKKSSNFLYVLVKANLVERLSSFLAFYMLGEMLSISTEQSKVKLHVVQNVTRGSDFFRNTLKCGP